MKRILQRLRWPTIAAGAVVVPLGTIVNLVSGMQLAVALSRGVGSGALASLGMTSFWLVYRRRLEPVGSAIAWSSRPHLWRVTVIVSLALLSVLGLGCGQLWHQEAEPPAASSTAAAAGGRTQRDQAGAFFDAFPSESYRTFEEAEAVAGYRIPRAGEAYPVGFGQTSLQWFPGNERPVSHTEYTYQPLAPTSIGIAVGPSSLWALKDGTSGEDILTSGDPTTIGDKQGFAKFGQIGWSFSFKCGSTGGEDIWCVVRAHSKIGRQGFDEFVASIR